MVPPDTPESWANSGRHRAPDGDAQTAFIPRITDASPDGVPGGPLEPPIGLGGPAVPHTDPVVARAAARATTPSVGANRRRGVPEADAAPSAGARQEAVVRPRRHDDPGDAAPRPRNEAPQRPADDRNDGRQRRVPAQA
ncbi:hypothetical protein, partial [Couchioplanes caeruleus]